MIDSEIISNRCNNIWLCNHSLDGYTLTLQNRGHPCDVAQSSTSSDHTYRMAIRHLSFVITHVLDVVEGIVETLLYKQSRRRHPHHDAKTLEQEVLEQHTEEE